MKHFLLSIISLIIAVFIIFVSFDKFYYQDYVIDCKSLLYKDYASLKDSLESYDILESFSGTITAYGPDCEGCIGITASGYDVRNTIYYDDKEYGKVLIVAGDKKYPFGTIVRFKNIKNKDPFIAIVLDRGSAIGLSKRSQFDLLFENESCSYDFGIHYNALFEILRYGF